MKKLIIGLSLIMCLGLFSKEENTIETRQKLTKEIVQLKAQFEKSKDEKTGLQLKSKQKELYDLIFKKQNKIYKTLKK